MDRLSGRVLNVEADRDGSTTSQDLDSGDTVLYLDDASDFSETGGHLILPDGTKVTYTSADMDLDTVTLASPLTADIPEDTLIKTHPVIVTRWASCEIFGYDDPLNVLVPHSYWPWLKLGARDEADQELCTVIYDSNDWVISDVQTARPELSDDFASRSRVFRYTSEGVTLGFNGVKLDEDIAGTITSARMKSDDVVTSDATFDLLLNGVSIATLVIPSGEQFSTMLENIDVDFEVGDRLRVSFTDPSDATPNIVVWVYANLATD